MSFDKKAFLNTDLGVDLINTVKNIERVTDKLGKAKVYEDEVKYTIARNLYMERLSVHKLWLIVMYQKEYVFTRNDDYFGLVTEDESDWLIKINKNNYGGVNDWI